MCNLCYTELPLRQKCIYPQSLLQYTSMLEENFNKCWALSNLRPLEATINVKKSNKVNYELP